jgi:hypothetical protein
MTLKEQMVQLDNMELIEKKKDNLGEKHEELIA